MATMGLTRRKGAKRIIRTVHVMVLLDTRLLADVTAITRKLMPLGELLDIRSTKLPRTYLTYEVNITDTPQSRGEH